MSEEIRIPDEVITNKIYWIRNQKAIKWKRLKNGF